MHHARGLVRFSSSHVVKKLERSAVLSSAVHHVKECFVPVVLIDANGHCTAVPLVQTPKMLKFVEKLPNTEAILAIQDARALYLAASSSFATFSLSNDKEQHKDHFRPQGIEGDEIHRVCDHLFGAMSKKKRFPVLFVKGSVLDARKELDHRQVMLLSRLEGKQSAADPTTTEQVIKEYRERAPIEAQIVKKELELLKDIAVFRGLVQQLCVSDSKTALEVALDRRIRVPLCGAAGSLAKIVDLMSKEAVEKFFQAFSGVDSKLPASQTCSTSLALRIKKEFLALEKRTSNQDLPSWISSCEILRLCQEYNVDPGSVYPTDAYAIQQWASSFFLQTDLPAARRAAVMKVVKERCLLPRRVCLSALSAWCGSDLEKEWIEYSMNNFTVLYDSTENDRIKYFNSALHTKEDDKEKKFNFRRSTPLEIARKTACELILNDPRRNLVDNRLLHIYATLLDSGEISPTTITDLSSSFSSFLEECGDCHSLRERPDSFSFLISLCVEEDGPNRPLHDILLRLAPRCSFWTTMLQNFSLSASPFIRVYSAPFDELRVEVRLPSRHECVEAAKKLSLCGTLPAMFPILWKDEHLLVINKPAGWATSRHALSCTQNGDPTTLDVVSVLLERFSTSFFTSLARCGVVHRLDTDTSGCLIFATSEEAVNSLRHQMGTSAMFSHFGKVYLALCVVVELQWQALPLTGVIKDHTDPKITTSYRVLEFFPKSRVAFLECRLQQGKKHQIRRHLASMGMPIVGDVIHGGAACAQSSIISRVALHASSVSVLHPCSGENITFTAPLPTDFTSALYFLRKTEV